MGSSFNFNNFGADHPPEAGGGGGGRPPGGSFPLTRQHSVYSLTFDEFQSTVAGTTKDFGSMNMDELLRSIWSAEENQNFGSTSGGVGGGGGGGGSSYLQRQGSLTLPRTLSQKTVDEVWRDMAMKDYNSAGKDTAGGSIGGGFGVPQGQPTLGEITLEEFLFRVGVVKEDTQFASANTNNNNSVSVGFFSELSRPVNNPGSEFGISNPIAMQSANLPLAINGARSSAPQQPMKPQQQKQQLLPKQATLAYGTPPPMGIPQLNTSMVQSGGVGMVGLGGNNGVTVKTGSPTVSPDGMTMSNGNTSSVSPVPYVFNGGLRGRKTAVLEKVVERRQRRMIKNRESAARSRARKQAYTMELEAEIAKLKEENEELQKKQAELIQMQTGAGEDESMNQQNEKKKKQCLRRTQTGPW